MTSWRDTPLWRRYSRLWGADPVRDIDDELDFHLEMRVRDLVNDGLTQAEARERAAAEFGNVARVRAQMTEIGERRVRTARRGRRMEDLVADVRYAMRHFRRTPLSTLTMIVVLSLGIGTSVVLFTVLNSLATLPAPGIERDASLVRIRGTMRLQNMDGVLGRRLSWPEVQEYAGRTDLFSDVAAYAYATAVVSTGGEAATSLAAHVVYATPNYFSILGVRPVLGSEPAPEPDVMQLTSAPGAVISHALWQQHFGSAPDVIGRTLRINDTPVEVVGVAPPRFIGTDGSGSLAVWVPLAAYPLLERRSRAAFLSYDSMFLQAAARTAPGVDAAATTPVVAGIAQRAFRPGQSGATTLLPNSDVTNAQGEAGSADVVPMRAMNNRVGDRAFLSTSAAAGAFALLVLLITCTNVSALMVGLAAARRREIGVRLSLGAPRRRLIRQLLTESVLLALVAAAVGLGVTAMGIRLIRATLVNVQLVIDWRVTLATCAVAIITGILFGLSPALHATRAGVGAVLKGASQSVVGTRSRLQRALVVAQVTLTQPLLVGLGVVIVTMITDLGAPTRTAVTERIAEVELVAWAGTATPAEGSARLDALVERVAAMPGVTAAFPMQMGTITMPLTVHPDDRVTGIEYGAAMDMRMVAAPAGWFDAFEIPFVRGRDFDDAERAQAAGAPASTAALEREILGFGTVIIGSDLARRLWGSADPLGRRLVFPESGRSTRTAPPAPLVVVGVVDAAAAGPSEVEGNAIRAFVPYSPMNSGVVARTAGPAAPMLDELRRVVTAAAPQMPVWRVQTMAQREAEFRRDVVQMSSAVAGGGLLALLLSAIGLYAVVSFAVGQRTREIGIRTALGARRGQVVRMFFLKGLALSALGLALGLPLSMMATRLIVRTLDWPVASPPLIGVAIAVVVLVVASVAAWIPARRASTIDPLAALRTE